jgi:predicted phosphodiesterase
MYDDQQRLTRRDALKDLSAGTLLALGLWPGALRAAEHGDSESFPFLVINDTHCMSADCGAYLEGVVKQMKAENADFCLHAGDLTEKGERDYFATVRDVFKELGVRTYPVIGNHDYQSQTDRRAYTQLFPLRINYYFRHRGWQFLGLDSSDGLRYEKTQIQSATLDWVDDNLPRLERERPTVILTHFPLGAGVTYRPANADDLLDRFRDYNLQAVFSGHFHGFTERQTGKVVLTTNRCCALKRDNHDGTKEKGYFICTAHEGKITRKFVEYKPV